MYITVAPQLCCDMSHHVLVIKGHLGTVNPLSKFSLRGFGTTLTGPLIAEISRSFLKPSLLPFSHVAVYLFLVTSVGVLGRKGGRTP